MIEICIGKFCGQLVILFVYRADYPITPKLSNLL